MKKYLSVLCACIVVVLFTLYIGNDEGEGYEAMTREKILNSRMMVGDEEVRLIPSIACLKERSCDLSGHFRIDQTEAKELGVPTIDVDRGEEIRFTFDTKSPEHFTFSRMDLLTIEGGNIENDSVKILGQRGHTVYYTFRANWGGSQGLQTFVSFPVFFHIK
ncbi:hypothetical protein H0266_15985 [Halobacillus locisalis]|uniref:Uncharacterized protein n=1 Tax=Halobacillus locisalis TaxID=220753 RepID=A0A838CWU2_9BACI|nr:hypothetical protein [Halobacillus locisalis]MBA2176398.1 hypothetical protein [Halobacillus locisalis]